MPGASGSMMGHGGGLSANPLEVGAPLLQGMNTLAIGTPWCRAISQNAHAVPLAQITGTHHGVPIKAAVFPNNAFFKTVCPRAPVRHIRAS